MIEVVCSAPGHPQYIRIPLPDTAGTWEATRAFNDAAYTIPAGTRRPLSVVNGNNIIDLHMACAIWTVHAEPILELRRRIKA